MGKYQPPQTDFLRVISLSSRNYAHSLEAVRASMKAARLAMDSQRRKDGPPVINAQPVTARPDPIPIPAFCGFDD